MLTGIILGTAIANLALAKASVSCWKPENKKQTQEIKKVADTILEEHNLKSKGVSIVDSKKAYFQYFDNIIGINMKKDPLAVFHEIGHAYIANNRKSKTFNKYGPLLTLISMGFALSPLFIDKKYEWEKEDCTTAEKITDSIRDNAPALAVASYIPIVKEEASASIWASKFAKPHLSKNLYGKMMRGNIFGFTTYLLSTLMLGLVAKDAQSYA